jgi:hypothetical protein
MPSDDSHAAKSAPGPSVFLSYASADRAAARALRDTLAAAGLEVWLDEEELAGGEAWDAKIRNQIRTCTYFMPVISATTETRREGYFRREWRFAIERTLDLADDVMFLVPVVIDGTRDRGARVPEKFLSVQWLRAPGGVATPELRQLAEKLAKGDALAHPPAPVADDEPPLLAGRKDRKDRKNATPPPPFPVFPPYPEPGHHFRFCYNIVLWAGHMVHALWMHLPRMVRVIASVVIVFNIISWAFRETKRDRPTQPEKAAAVADIAREISAASLPKNSPDGAEGDAIKRLIGAASHAFQARQPLAVVNFGGTGEDAAAYAESAFKETFKLLQTGGQASLSPLPLEEDDDDDDALARGTALESQFVLTGFARRQAPGEPVLLTVKLYHVKQRTVLWSETFDAAKTEAAAAARLVAEAVRSRTVPAKP